MASDHGPFDGNISDVKLIPDAPQSTGAPPSVIVSRPLSFSPSPDGAEIARGIETLMCRIDGIALAQRESARAIRRIESNVSVLSNNQKILQREVRRVSKSDEAQDRRLTVNERAMVAWRALCLGAAAAIVAMWKDVQELRVGKSISDLWHEVFK
jgi:hypothetical protein